MYILIVLPSKNIYQTKARLQQKQKQYQNHELSKLSTLKRKWQTTDQQQD